jgi:hypothetical protein
MAKLASSPFSPLRIDYKMGIGYEGSRLRDFAPTVRSLKEGKWNGCLVPS